MLRAAFLALAFAVATAGPAAARSAVALALEVKGATRPVVEPYAELEAGQSVRLDGGAEIEFLHYATCETVTVKGGDLAFSEQRFSVRGGEIAEVKRSKCPTTVTLQGDSQIGGAVLRGSPGPRVLSLPTRPGFVVVGAARWSYRTVRIRREGQTIFEGALAGPRFEWPKDRAPLDADGSYTLELLSETGATRAFALRAEERRGAPPLTVVRLD
jgi:hypothetical protein